MKKRSSSLKFLAAIPALVIMLMIFMFSSREADESTAQSMRISYYIVEAGEMIRGIELSSEEREILAAAIDGPVRKGAHMTEYAILSFAVWFALVFWTNSKEVLYFSTLVFCVLYAASDEFHQTFVRGRSGKIQDVFVDSAGVVIALFILFLTGAPRGSKGL